MIFNNAATPCVTRYVHTERYSMPISKVIIEQIKQIIPPLNGTLHKGQSGASSSSSVGS